MTSHSSPCWCRRFLRPVPSPGSLCRASAWRLSRTARGGLVARSFLTGAAAGFLARFTSLLTLHSPNTGSGVATIAATVAGLLGTAATAFTGAGLPAAAAFATTLSGLALNPSRAELIPGNPTLAAIAAAEPVAGVTYHTFGGISTDFARLWADIYTPDSTIPWFIPFVPFPLFHWGSTPVGGRRALEYRVFRAGRSGSAAALGHHAHDGRDLRWQRQLPISHRALAICWWPMRERACRSRRRIPTNFLNHLEALSDPTLQAQVVAILLRLRTPVSTGTARVTLSPFPARPNVSTLYTVTAVDSVTGVAIPPNSVEVVDSGHVVANPSGGTFSYRFTSHQVTHCKIDPRTHERDCERVDVWPTVFVQLPGAYGRVRVNTGL